jgi:hypothetical protein
MNYGIYVAALLLYCCVNHQLAAALEVQPGVQLNQQLAGSSRGAEGAVAPLDAAIGSSSTQLAARSFRRTRKLLTTALHTQQRKLQQIFIGAPIGGAYTFYDASSGTWWQVGNGATCCCCIIKTLAPDVPASLYTQQIC